MPTALQKDPEGCPDAAPERLHELKHDSSVLALAVSDQYIFAGTHKGEIVVWSLATFAVVATVQAHKQCVLCLHLSDDGRFLLSSACEPVVNVWCPRTFVRLFEIYSTYDVGDVFSVVYSPQRETVYLGTQTQYIQWVSLRDPLARVAPDAPQHPNKRHHRFFDSHPAGGTSTPRRTEEVWNLIPRPQAVLEIDAGAVQQFAHFGWVYCMLVAKGPTMLVGPDDEVLLSGGGDGTIKMWRLCDAAADAGAGNETGEPTAGAIQELMCLGQDDAESVVSLVIDGSFLYSGKLGGIIELWDLDTKQKLRVIKAHEHDVMTLQMRFGLLWSAATGGSASVSCCCLSFPRPCVRRAYRSAETQHSTLWSGRQWPVAQRQPGVPVRQSVGCARRQDPGFCGMPETQRSTVHHRRKRPQRSRLACQWHAHHGRGGRPGI